MMLRQSILLAVAVLLATPAWGQSTTNPNVLRPNSVPRSDGTVRMNLQGDVRLDALVGYLSQRLGIQFQYDDSIAARTVTIRTPDAIPVSSLPTLLGNVLRTEGLALVDTDQTGIQRIVPASDMAALSRITRAPRPTLPPPTTTTKPLNPATPITQIFVLENLSAASVADVLTPFLSGDAASLSVVSDSNTLIVTDYASSIETLTRLIALVDQPAGRAGFTVYEAQNQSAETLASQVENVLIDEGSNGSTDLQLIPQPLGGRIIVAGSSALVTKAEALLRRLDIELGVRTEIYRIRNTTAERIDKLIEGFIEPPNDSEASFQSTVDEEGNLLIVRTSADVHRQIAELIETLDTAVDADQSPIQFYKLKNASAIDVLYSLLALQEAVGGFGVGGFPTTGFSPFGGLIPNGFGAGAGLLNPNVTGGVPVTSLPLPPDAGNRQPLVPQQTNPLARPTFANGVGNIAGRGNAIGQTGFGNNAALSGTTALANQGFAGNASQGVFGQNNLGSGTGVATLPGGARVSADVSTNSLIVFAPANIQPIYAELIESLDQRRPQVLIEAKVIAVNTTDDYTLGVEVSAGDREGAERLFKFSSFGLSEVDPDTGNLRIIPGLGFNGTLIDPDVADVVVRALATHEFSRVLAAPKILVNDNSTGTLESVVSVPFSSVNASDTVATTSLGGNQQAGTIVTVTPHINEDDHLQLEFDVEFSTFTGMGSDGLPPARQIDRVGSSVTIPSGKTVVVGGLKRIGQDNDFIGIPWAERIPIIRELTSRTDDTYRTTSFFLFIRPVVLRDSRFADLRYLSENEANQACIPGDYPTSSPELIH
ncbi:MAG: secretin N-terminal domain-containing protein [Planctomycetota bacterium]